MPRRRLLLQPACNEYAPALLPGRLREPRQRLQLLLAHALPQAIARITLENINAAEEPVAMYYQIDYTLTQVPRGRQAYFHWPAVPPREPTWPIRGVAAHACWTA